MFFKKKIKQIYLDHAAGTQIDSSVFKKMMPYFSNQFFNPGAIYKEAFIIREVLETARVKIAKIISARSQEIIFTEGGTEANNLILRGLVSKWREKNNNKKPHIIISQIEHASILETCKDLETKGFIDVSYLSTNEAGVINIKELKNTIKEHTILVSIAYVNGEIGVIQDIRTIAKTLRHYRKQHKTNLPYFHTDAVQAVNYLDINVQKLGVDFMTINGSKIYGPKKIAVLYKKADIQINPIITGGSQEFGLRAGTENIPFIVGFTEALSLTQKMREKESQRLLSLRLYMETLLKDKIKIDFSLNGEQTERIPNIVNISIPNISSEEVILRLDAVGVKASMKSACKSGEAGDSHVIRALRDKNTQSLRFSMGRNTSKKDIYYFVGQLVNITNKMQKIFNKYIK